MTVYFRVDFANSKVDMSKSHGAKAGPAMAPPFFLFNFNCQNVKGNEIKSSDLWSRQRENSKIYNAVFFDLLVIVCNYPIRYLI